MLCFLYPIADSLIGDFVKFNILEFVVRIKL